MLVLDNEDPIIFKFTVDDIHNTLYFSIDGTPFPLEKVVGHVRSNINPLDQIQR